MRSPAIEQVILLILLEAVTCVEAKYARATEEIAEKSDVDLKEPKNSLT